MVVSAHRVTLQQSYNLSTGKSEKIIRGSGNRKGGGGCLRSGVPAGGWCLASLLLTTTPPGVLWEVCCSPRPLRGCFGTFVAQSVEVVGRGEMAREWRVRVCRVFTLLLLGNAVVGTRYGRSYNPTILHRELVDFFEGATAPFGPPLAGDVPGPPVAPRCPTLARPDLRPASLVPHTSLCTNGRPRRTGD